MISMKSTAIRLFTSGTTASPKDIELPRSALMTPPDQLAPYLRLNDVGLWFESLGFINGIFMTIEAILMHVKVIKIKSKFHTKYVCKLIEQHKVTWMFLETSLTETGIIAYQRQSGNTESSGYVSGNVQLKIVSFIPSETQRSLDPNILGQFYSNWFRTGDLGLYDKNGEIYIRGRINQLYKYNEHIISPTLTENVLQCHFAVSEAAVIPVPYKLNEKHAMAFVTKVPGKEVTEEELKQFIVKNLNLEYQLRAGVIFLSQLPRIPNGKINRKLLHDWAQTYIY
ncbi:luciferin 4-monooxygenase, partial [Lasius niger]